MKKNAKPKGFGFGDAMFAMKDLQGDYEAFGGSPQVKEEVKIVSKMPIKENKTKISNQPKSNVPKVKVVEQKNTNSFVPKTEFKVNPGKEFGGSKLTITPLSKLKVSPSSYELSTSKMPTKWQYNLFTLEGQPAQTLLQSPYSLSFNFNTEDIRQGSLGNCYFITALASLAPHFQILRQRIPDHKKYQNNDKYFIVNIVESGKVVQVRVDNLFSMKYGKPVFEDISVLVIEKAYAMVYGNYQVLNMGYAIDAMRDLSGAPCDYIDMKDPTFLLESVEKAFKRGYPLVIASKKEVKNGGISPAHSYNVLSYSTTNHNIYLQLRDPRGHTNAKFQTPASLESQTQNGIFWIGYEDLLQCFQVISQCKITKNSSYFYHAFSKSQLTNNTGSILISSKKEAKATITIHQKHKKFYDEKFGYDMVRLFVAEVKVAEGSIAVVKTVGCEFGVRQTCEVEVMLEAGKSYIAVGQRTVKQKVVADEVFTLSFYTQSDSIQFQQPHGQLDLKPYVMSHITLNKHRFTQKTTAQGLYSLFGDAFGHVCIYYQNRSTKNVIEELDYTPKNVEIGEKKVSMAPGQRRLLMHAIGSQNNGSHMFSYKSKTYYK